MNPNLLSHESIIRNTQARMQQFSPELSLHRPSDGWRISRNGQPLISYDTLKEVTSFITGLEYQATIHK
jgi:hypothetical protein